MIDNILIIINLLLFVFEFQMAGQDPKWQKDASDQNFDYMFKLLIIGNSSVGKTSFLFRYADDSFTSAFVSTVGIDFKVKTVFRNDKRVKLQIWVSTISKIVEFDIETYLSCLNFLNETSYEEANHSYCSVSFAHTELKLSFTNKTYVFSNGESESAIKNRVS